MAEEIKSDPYWLRFTDNGKELVYDKEFSRNVGLIHGIEGICIPKDYFAHLLRIECLHKFRDEYFQQQGDASDFLNREYSKLKKLLKKEIKAMRFLLTEIPDWKSEKYCKAVQVEKVKLALSVELFSEYLQIQDILEDYFDDCYGYDWKLILHDIEYPDETAEQWKERETKEAFFYEKIKNEIKENAEKESQ